MYVICLYTQDQHSYSNRRLPSTSCKFLLAQCIFFQFYQRNISRWKFNKSLIYIVDWSGKNLPVGNVPRVHLYRINCRRAILANWDKLMCVRSTEANTSHSGPMFQMSWTNGNGNVVIIISLIDFRARER